MSDELQAINDHKPRPRAADDFDTIRAKLAELRREREQDMANRTDDPAPAAMDWADCCILGCLP